MNENRKPRTGRQAGWRKRGTKRTKNAARICAARSIWNSSMNKSYRKYAFDRSSKQKNATYTNPKHLRTPRRARERVPHAWRETACSHGANAKQVQPMVNVMNYIGMVRQDMITGGQTETESSAKEEHAKDEPVVGPRVGVITFDVRIVGDGESDHPQRRQEMTIYITGLVMEVEAAPKGVEV